MEIWRRAKAMVGVRGIPDGMNERVPAGQYVTPKQPVMNMSYAPRLTTGERSLELTGLVENPLTLRWADFEALA